MPHVTIPKIRKFLVAVLGVIAEIVNLGLVNGETQHVLSLIVSIAVAAGVYTVQNVMKAKNQVDD